MKMIALMGLVSVEKVALAAELAEHYDSVTVVDNIARLPIDRLPAHADYCRVDGDFVAVLDGMLHEITSEMVVIAVSETANPADVLTALDAYDATIVSLIDTRTCDCFPATREMLEDYADVVVNLPVDVESVLKAIDRSTRAGSGLSNDDAETEIDRISWEVEQAAARRNDSE